MDLDALATARHDDWERLDALARRRASTGPPPTSSIERYQAGATDLSLVQATAGPRSATGSRSALARAGSASRARPRTRSGSSRTSRWSACRPRLPPALADARGGRRRRSSPRSTPGGSPPTRACSRTSARRRSCAQLAEEGFVAYYSENPAASFAGSVWTNNAWIAAQCVAFGIPGVWVPYVILQNAQNLGVTAGRSCSRTTRPTRSSSTSRRTACSSSPACSSRRQRAADLLGLGRARAAHRGAALAEDARALFTVAIGLVFFLLRRGPHRGLRHPRAWPWPVKIGIGALALGGFLAYMLVLGRRAACRRDRRPRRVRRGRDGAPRRGLTRVARSGAPQSRPAAFSSR